MTANVSFLLHKLSLIPSLNDYVLQQNKLAYTVH